MKLCQKILSILVMVTVFAGPAIAADYNWSIQTSGAAGDNVTAFLEQYAKWVAEDSNGRIQISIMPADSVVKYTETLDAVGANILQGDVTDPSYFAGKDPAYSLIGNMV